MEYLNKFLRCKEYLGQGPLLKFLSYLPLKYPKIVFFPCSFYQILRVLKYVHLLSATSLYNVSCYTFSCYFYSRKDHIIGMYEGPAKSSVTNRLPWFYPRYILKCFSALEWCVE